MSYNYDYNPWDDNNPAQPPPNQYQTNSGYGASEGYSNQYSTTPSGYSNPAEQYAVQDSWNTAGADQQEQAENYQQEQYQEEPVANDQRGEVPRQESRLGQFLRAHVPLCGACMDCTTPVLDTLLKYVNRDLLTSKLFYFFFYSAFGSLFPLMGVYFKQLGMNPAQVGVLTGVRPFIEIFSAPFWSGLAERFQKSKALLLFSLASWIVFTYSLAHIRPPASACIAFNDTNYVLYTPYSANDLSNYDVGQLEGESNPSSTPESVKENELFMSGMPANSAEKKDQILADEENVIDQGRRRRRKRSYYVKPTEQLQRPSTWFSRYRYSTDANDGMRNSDALNKLDIDLGNDFEDTSLDSGVDSGDDDDDDGGGRGGHWHRTFASENSDAAEYRDELDQQTSFSARSKRSLDYERGKPEESQDESEPEEMNERDERHNARPKASDENDIEPEGGENPSDQRDEESKHEHSQQAVNNNGKEQDRQGSANLPADTGLGVNKTRRIYKQRHKTPPTHIVGMSPITVEYAVNYNKEKHSQFVTPMFSTIVYKLDDIKEVFFLLLLLIALGEFFSAPALTIADNTTLSCLGKNTDLYGRQRMFGSIGWAITLFLVGMALDNSTRIADHPCGPHQRERSYTVCFTIFSLLMGCAFITATQFKFNYGSRSSGGSSGATNGANGNQELVTKAIDGNTVITTTIGNTDGANNIDELYASTKPREIFNTAPPVNAPPPGSHLGGAREKFEFLDKWKSAVFAQSTWELPEWFGVFRQFQNTMHLTYLFITWFLGCGVGLVLTFLFWHLQDVGGTPTLFGICSIINHISEILAYFFSSFFIKRFGHTRVLSVGLGCNVVRFLYVAFLSNPYYALPFELIQGITHATCFAACCSYISHVSKPELKASTQGVMQGLHNGIGKACGALLGGYMINAIGSRASFCIYGLSSGCVLAGFLYVRKHNGG